MQPHLMYISNFWLKCKNIQHLSRTKLANDLKKGKLFLIRISFEGPRKRVAKVLKQLSLVFTELYSSFYRAIFLDKLERFYI